MKPSDFLRLLWGSPAPGLMVLWIRDGKRSYYLKSWQGADVIANGRPDVYTGVALAGRDHGRHSRCPANATVALTGLWLDIDVNGGPDRKTGVAPSKSAALELARALLEPTIVVDSGYGLHAWWLLEQPWVFRTVLARDQAAAASAQWYQLHRARAQADGWTIDHTHDLARLLRLPGTVNAKGLERAPVRVHAADGPRYEQQQLLALAATAGPTRFPAAPIGGGEAPAVRPPTGAAPIALVEAFCLADEDFAATWNHERSENWSMSEYDLAIASRAAQAKGITDQQLADVIAYHRQVRGDDKQKAARIDYLRRTVAKARERAAQDVATQDLGRMAERARAGADARRPFTDDHTSTVEGAAAAEQFYGGHRLPFHA